MTDHTFHAGSMTATRGSDCYVPVVTVRKPNPDIIGGYEETKHVVPLCRSYDRRRVARNAAQKAIAENRNYFIKAHDVEYDAVRAINEERL